jgi:hypothetical protein
MLKYLSSGPVTFILSCKSLGSKVTDYEMVGWGFIGEIENVSSSLDAG